LPAIRDLAHRALPKLRHDQKAAPPLHNQQLPQTFWRQSMQVKVFAVTVFR
jgi:hypothetical protein